MLTSHPRMRKKKWTLSSPVLMIKSLPKYLRRFPGPFSLFNTQTTFIPPNKTKPNKDTNSNIQNSLPVKLLPFKDVFSEIYANELPPHKPYNYELKEDQFYHDIYQQLFGPIPGLS